MTADHVERTTSPPTRALPTTRSWLAVGAITGLAWSASLRAWMVEVAGPAQSVVTWSTFTLVVAPGIALGLLVAHGARLRAAHRPPPRWLPWSPAVLAVAVLDPTIFRHLIQTGEGTGAIHVALVGLTGGYALSRRRWGALRVLASVIAVLGTLAVGAFSAAAEPDPARFAWAALLGMSLMAVLAVGCSLLSATHQQLETSGRS